MSERRAILVFGATGEMGRAVVARLLADRENDWQVRAFTRDPGGPNARRLAEAGGGRVELVRGDLNSDADVARAVAGAYGVFCNTDFWNAFNRELERSGWRLGADPWAAYRRAEAVERDQGLRVVRAAEAAGVGHLVYCSLEASRELSAGRVPCPHFDSKAAVEKHLRDERERGDGWAARNATVLVTLPYFENFVFVEKLPPGDDGRPFIPTGLGMPRTVFDVSDRDGPKLLFKPPMGDDPWPMVALDDIAWFAARVFSDRGTWGGRTWRVGSEALPMAEVVATFTRVTGVQASYEPYTLEEYAAQPTPEAADLAAMYRFIREVGTPRDYPALRRAHPGLTTFEGWLRSSGWRGVGG